MRTPVTLLVFAYLLAISPAARKGAAAEHRIARARMAEAKQTSNPVRLIGLAMDIRDSLKKAALLAPDDVEIRLDLVRFYVMTPRVLGGSLDKAREEAAEIARRDAPLGAFAAGYIAYREKEYGPARHALQEAARSTKMPATKQLALTWLGWLSQETQQWSEAFDAFAQVEGTGLYEIGRTAVFCNCELARGEQALQAYIAAKRTAEMPSLAHARYQLGLLYEKRGDRAGAKRELEIAWQLDRTIAGLKDARKRLGR